MGNPKLSWAGNCGVSHQRCKYMHAHRVHFYFLRGATLRLQLCVFGTVAVLLHSVFPQEKPYCFLDVYALFLQIPSSVVVTIDPSSLHCPGALSLEHRATALGHSLSLGSTESTRIMPEGLGGLTTSQERSLHLLCYRNKQQMAAKTAGTNMKNLFIFCILFSIYMSTPQECLPGIH